MLKSILMQTNDNNFSTYTQDFMLCNNVTWQLLRIWQCNGSRHFRAHLLGWDGMCNLEPPRLEPHDSGLSVGNHVWFCEMKWAYLMRLWPCVVFSLDTWDPHFSLFFVTWKVMEGSFELRGWTRAAGAIDHDTIHHIRVCILLLFTPWSLSSRAWWW